MPPYAQLHTHLRFLCPGSQKNGRTHGVKRRRHPLCLDRKVTVEGTKIGCCGNRDFLFNKESSPWKRGVPEKSLGRYFFNQGNLLPSGFCNMKAARVVVVFVFWVRHNSFDLGPRGAHCRQKLHLQNQTARMGGRGGKEEREREGKGRPNDPRRFVAGDTHEKRGVGAVRV